ncbi:hypothetical protein D5H75_12385 [Bailinhaonella thermotolerans]|uniref:Uncharacterized protein n=2 Tax=Bailinhaonella thermotolerans TaxID=1070861 RepID=A0A3A4AXC9_9ACTN|nr:hypothetical protein D5H75_12385 [Bailinhaonella thermotolerans]
MFPFNTPQGLYLEALLRTRVHRARTAPTRGASAVEWVIITAIIAGVAMALALLIKQLVEDKSNEIKGEFGKGGGNAK